MQIDGRWRKSTRSFCNGECVEVRWVEPLVELRDSKDPAGPILRFAPEEWAAFLQAIKGGEMSPAAVQCVERQESPRRQ
jgi:hypothetical protein